MPRAKARARATEQLTEFAAAAVKRCDELRDQLTHAEAFAEALRGETSRVERVAKPG